LGREVFGECGREVGEVAISGGKLIVRDEGRNALLSKEERQKGGSGEVEGDQS
jgi:hypothetical protein